MEGAPVFGISLGSAAASIAASKGSKTELLANQAGERTTPTLVSYREDGGEVVGHAAKQLLHRHSLNTVSCMNRLVGRSFDDEGVREVESSLTCKLGRGEDGRVCYVIPVKGGSERKVSVEDGLTKILQSLHETAGSFSDSGQKLAVVALTADSSVSQRNAVRLCCETAGFEVMRIISEPAAICLAHSIGQRNKTEKSHVLVYNLGANTLTISLMLVAGGMYSQLATRTLSEGVGGREFDRVIADFLSTEFEKQWKVSVRGNEKCRFKLLAAAESAKRALSTVHTTSVHLESLHDGLDLTYSLSRGRFEGLCTGVFRRCVNSDLISEVLKVGGVTRGAVDQVLLAGSSCKIPLIQTLMEREFPGCEDVVGVSSQVSPEEAVVVGCALQAGLMRERRESGREEEEEEGMEVACVPCDLWIKCDRQTDQLLVPSLTPLPCQNTISLPLKFEDTSSCCSLVLFEKLTNQERELAKLLVPVGECESGEDVKVRVTLVWTADNVITMTTTKTDSDWSCTLSLSCEQE